jgi:hypothetical protein
LASEREREREREINMWTFLVNEINTDMMV